MIANSYDNNVFINCPYDKEFKRFMDVIIFTVIILGFTPRLALEASDSGENRIDKIIDLIKDSKYSIHDLSRMVASKSGEFFRLNMPLELGIDFGCKKIVRQYNDKKLLILDREQYRFQKAISDLSGVDIKAYGKHEIKIVQCIRDWFVVTTHLRSVPCSDKIMQDYMESFHPYLLEEASLLGFNESNYIYELTTAEFMHYATKWKSTEPIYENIISA